jgi:hypothetical protein
MRKPDARREIKMLTPRAQQIVSQKGESQTKHSHKPNKKIVPAAAETETKKCESQTTTCVIPTKPNKKSKRANSTGYPPCRHRSNKKENPESRTPPTSCAKTQRQLVAGELEIFARIERRIINARTQFNEGNEPFAAAKTKKAQAIPMA